MNKKKQSKYLDLGPKKDRAGRRGYDPEQILQYLYENTDRIGVIIYSQKDMADAIDMSRESMGNFYMDFQTLGFIEKIDARNFQFIVNPKDVIWDEELYETFFALRKRHQPAYNNK